MAVIDGKVVKQYPEVVYLQNNNMDIGRKGDTLVVFKKADNSIISPSFSKHKDLLRWVKKSLMKGA